MVYVRCAHKMFYERSTRMENTLIKFLMMYCMNYAVFITRAILGAFTLIYVVVAILDLSMCKKW